MKLLLKVVKSSQVYNDGDTVFIDNTVNIPPPPPPVFDPEEEEGMFFLEKERIAEERKREEQINAEIERRTAILEAEITQRKKEILDNAEKARIGILEDASADAAKTKADAKEEAIAIKEIAKKSGYDEGYADGKAESLKQCEKYVQAAAQFLSGINAKKEAYFISHEDELLKTVLEMVKKITLNELKTDKDTIFRILKQASKTFRNDDYLKISFAEGDVDENVVTDLEFIHGVVGNIKEIDIEILPDAEEGTVIIDNGSEIIDASVPTQLDLLKEIMNNSRK